MSNSPKPPIFEFLDLIQYLQSYFQSRKDADPSFTYTAWSAELGLGSKTILRFILQRKRRISARTAIVLQSHLRLDDLELRYFGFLLSYTQPKSESERGAAGAQLIRLQRMQYKQDLFDTEAATKDVLAPVVLTLLTFKDFNGTPTDISRYLNLDEARVQVLLDGLVTSNLARVQNGRYVLDTTAFNIASSPHATSLINYHEYWLDRGKQAIQLDFKTRRFKSLKFALTPEEFDQALNRIEEFAATILSSFDNANLNGRRLYMIENAIFPISDVYPSTLAASSQN